MIFIFANVLTSACSDSILWNSFLWASSANIFLLAKTASAEQKPLAEMDLLLVCG